MLIVSRLYSCLFFSPEGFFLVDLTLMIIIYNFRSCSRGDHEIRHEDQRIHRTVKEENVKEEKNGRDAMCEQKRGKKLNIFYTKNRGEKIQSWVFLLSFSVVIRAPLSLLFLRRTQHFLPAKQDMIVLGNPKKERLPAPMSTFFRGNYILSISSAFSTTMMFFFPFLKGGTHHPFSNDNLKNET